MTESTTDLAQRLTQASDMLRRGLYDSTLRLLAGLPEDGGAADRLRAESWLGRNRRDKAAPPLDRCLSVCPQDPDLRILQARLKLLEHDALAAVDLLDGVWRDHPETPGVRFWLAQALRRDARFEDALDVGAGETTLQFTYERGMCCAALGLAEEALQAFDAVTATDPDHAAGWMGSYAPVLDLQGPDAARQRIVRALGCPGANGRYWGMLVAHDLLQGAAGQAQQMYADKLARFPKRRALADSLLALQPLLTPASRALGLSAQLLRAAMAEARTTGLVLEFGVRRGTSVRHLAAVAGQPVHGFDSFCGLPPGWASAPEGALSTGDSLPPVPPNVALHPGWFDDSLPPFLAAHPGPVRLVNIDSDLYASAKTVLTALTPRLQPGSIIIFDELIGNRSWREDEYKALQEFIQETGAQLEILFVTPAFKQVALRLTGWGSV